MTEVEVTSTPLWEPLLVTNLTKPGNLVKGCLQATVKPGGGCLGRDRTVGRTLPLVFPLGGPRWSLLASGHVAQDVLASHHPR